MADAASVRAADPLLALLHALVLRRAGARNPLQRLLGVAALRVRRLLGHMLVNQPSARRADLPPRRGLGVPRHVPPDGLTGHHFCRSNALGKKE